MIVLNSKLCSTAAQVAFAALEGGKAIRRTSWPDGQFLQQQPSGIVGVVRNKSLVRPPWCGPSSAEMDAMDWQVI